MESKLIKIKRITPAYSDDRGDIIDVLNEPVGHIGYITFQPGSLRAKHYHLKSKQYDYVIEGKIRLIVCKPDGSKREDHLLEPGMLTEIPAGIVHAYVAEEYSEMIDITTFGRQDGFYEKDTIRVDLDIS